MKIYALCTLSAGVDTLRLLVQRIPLSGVIGLAPRPASDGLSGVVDVSAAARSMSLPVYLVASYSMSAQADLDLLLGLDIDLLIVCGWQRLVPEWLIEQTKFGCIGIHGSPAGISGGRGRSPQNWALITGSDQFEISIFYLDPGIDSGPVIASRKFALNDRDDIVSSYLKTSFLVADMLGEAYASGALERREAAVQQQESAYLPQRTLDDGAIDWTRTASEISRFIAALGRPYPGATSSLNGTLVRIWRARPLGLPLEFVARPGQIMLCAEGGPIVVQTGDGLLLIDEFDAGGAQMLIGAIFTQTDFKAQVQRIIARHNEKFSHLPVSEMVCRLTRPHQPN